MVIADIRKKAFSPGQIPPIHPLLLALDGMNEATVDELIHELNEALEECIEDIDCLSWTHTVEGFRKQAQYFTDHHIFFHRMEDACGNAAKHAHKQSSQFILAQAFIEHPKRLEGLTLAELTKTLADYLSPEEDHDPSDLRQLREGIKDLLGTRIFFVDDSIRPAKIWLTVDFIHKFPEDPRPNQVKKRRLLYVE